MDELSVKRKTRAETPCVGSALRDDAGHPPKACPQPFSGVAEIIKLDPAHLRSKRPKPNDPANVPIDEHIGRHLKAIYGDVLKQPIPERFLDLLDQLESGPSQEEDHP